MTLYDRIMAIYPQLRAADFVSAIVLRDDGDGTGAYIQAWKHPTLPEPTQEQLDTAPAPAPDIEAMVVGEIQRRLDAFAQARGYDNIVSLCSYAASAHPRFKADAERGLAARDECWGISLQIKLDVVAGLRPVPTLDEVLAALPLLQWPEGL